MTLRDRLLAKVDRIRAIPGRLGLHRYQVWVRVTTWSGSRVQLGVPVTTETRILIHGQDPHVREVVSKDVIAGDAAMMSATYEIGPLTPEHAGGGVSYDVTNPPRGESPTEVTYVLKGPGLPEDGLLCARVSDDTDKPFRHMVRVRSKGRAGV